MRTIKFKTKEKAEEYARYFADNRGEIKRIGNNIIVENPAVQRKLIIKEYENKIMGYIDNL